MKEIVTIQVGGFANFVGSHFWNFQDELLGLAGDSHGDPAFKNQCLDMDALYRTGETPQGIITYTPRLLSVDFPGSLGSLSSLGTLYSEVSPASSGVITCWFWRRFTTWLLYFVLVSDALRTGNVSTRVSEPRKKNLFLQRLYDDEEQEKLTGMGSTHCGKNDSESNILDKDIVECLENDVQFWTDFSKVDYHPQSLYELNGLWMDIQEFDNYGVGRDALSGGLRGEEMNERLRFFVEECDHIQGIQFIVDDSGGFSGVAADFLENIADDYTNTPVLLYSVRDPGTFMNYRSQKQKISRKLHDAVSISKLSSFCKLIVPVGLPCLSRSKAATYLCIKDEKPYHCSAVYASALHSISLPFRMESLVPATDSYHVSGAVDIYGLVQMLAGQAGQNSVAILDVAMPVPSLAGQLFEQSLLGNLQPLTPEVAEDVEDLRAVESMIIHGVLESGVNRASISEVKDMIHAAYENAISRPMFSHLSLASCPLPIPLPFPSIFGDTVGEHGELLDSPVSGSHCSRGSLDVHSIPMAARLRSSSAILPFLENRLGSLRRFGIERGAPGTELLGSWGFGRDELEDMGETLFKMVNALDPHSQVSSDDSE
ncbi:uncharacterized protein LOC131158246 isoform X2 [Malania oleifera]|uniref:uncharacterized protein LOC131158246 isoform X2 n=1 Tax=Malania oleifera TaxID=397392 RepID=UPI0025AE6DCE|nr:uncharacterized protein LOC131158246 isoform X2 [Malania oleifera]